MAIDRKFLLGVAFLALAPPVAKAQAVTDGRNLAVQVCAACHYVGSPQPFDPVLQPPAPPFREIANRPGTTAQSLRRFVMNPHGGDRSVAVRMPNAMLLPEQADQVTAYILSLREPVHGGR